MIKGYLFDEVTDPLEKSKFWQGLHDDEEACKKDQCCPFDAWENGVYLEFVCQDLKWSDLITFAFKYSICFNVLDLVLFSNGQIPCLSIKKCRTNPSKERSIHWKKSNGWHTLINAGNLLSMKLASFKCVYRTKRVMAPNKALQPKLKFSLGMFYEEIQKYD